MARHDGPRRKQAARASRRVLVLAAAVSTLALAAPHFGGSRSGRAGAGLRPPDPGDARVFADLEALTQHREVEQEPEAKGLDERFHHDASGRVRDDLYRASVSRFEALQTDG